MNQCVLMGHPFQGAQSHWIIANGRHIYRVTAVRDGEAGTTPVIHNPGCDPWLEVTWMQRG